MDWKSISITFGSGTQKLHVGDRVRASGYSYGEYYIGLVTAITRPNSIHILPDGEERTRIVYTYSIEEIFPQETNVPIRSMNQYLREPQTL